MYCSGVAVLALILTTSAAAGTSTPEPTHARTWRVSLPALATSGGEQSVEAARVLSWIHRIDPDLLAVSREPGCEAVVLAVHGARSLPVSSRFARALVVLSDYHGAVERSARSPVPAAEVAAALAAPAMSGTLRELFERVHRGSRVYDRATNSEIAFEPGGIAWLERSPAPAPVGALVAGTDGYASTLVFQAVDDPIHAFARDLLAVRRQPLRVKALLEQNPLGFLIFDPDGLLRAAIERHPPAEPYPERAQRGLDLALDALSANVADSWGLDESTLARALLERPPQGRYVGLWHGHPGRRGGDPPSEDDRRVARISGRFVTLVEMSDGVDVHDLRREQTGPQPVRVRW